MRAIILAAGMGTRLRPLTDNKPKGLVEVNGVPMVENTITKLKEKGINEIIIVTGYLCEKYEYLKSKYGVKIIHNDKYDIYNNIYTMYLVKDYLGDSYVMDSDIYLNKNIFDLNINKSTYFSALKTGFTNEWILRVDQNDRVVEVEVGTENTAYINSGISYWTEYDGKFISNKISEIIKNGKFEELYWDDIVKDNIKDIDVRLHKLNENDVYEIDCIDDLIDVENALKNLN